MRDGSIPSHWLDLVKQSEELTCEDANELARLWACDEYNIEDSASASDGNMDATSPRITSSLSDSESQLLMPIMPDLNELTCRRSTRERKSPGFYDPSALSSSLESPSPKGSSSGFFSMFCLVTIATLTLPSYRA